MADQVSEQQKAELAKKRGAAAAQIKDPDERRKFIAAQGNAETSNKGLPADEHARLDKEADNTLATAGANVDNNIKTYHKGTDYVPKTGPAVLKQGEVVLDPEKGEKYRKAKANGLDATKEVLGGESEPKKEIRELRIRKGHGGNGHIIEHHHMSHPMEEHVTTGDDEMIGHVLGNVGNGDTQ